MRIITRLPLWSIASLFLPILAVIIIFVAFWLNLSGEEKTIFTQILVNHIGNILIGALLIITIMGILINWLISNLIVPMKKIVEETNIITNVNPLHRITVKGSHEIQLLKEVINDAAERVNGLRDDVREKIKAANAELEEEKDTLAALISEMEEGVLVCNMEGQILLYNKSSKKLLSDKNHINPKISGDSGLVGLGRSIFASLDKDLIVHALEDLLQQLGRGQAALVSHLVTSTKKNELLRIRVVPILHQELQMNGFILFLYDVTNRVEIATRRDKLFQKLTYSIRSSIGNVRAAIESIIDFPDMDEDHKKKFNSIIHDETIILSKNFNETIKDLSEQFKVKWLLEKMSGKDFLETVKRKAREKLDVEIEIESVEIQPWLKVESYSFIQMFLYLIEYIKNCGYDKITCRVNMLSACRTNMEMDFIYIDVEWNGEPLDIDKLRNFKDQQPINKPERLFLSFDEILSHHDAEIWSKSIKNINRSYVRVLLKSAEPVNPILWNPGLNEESRPEFYDFDLFHQAGQSEELDNRLLTDLSYTIFDTETTGLNPAEGDEIISIGAVRIINGRLLRDEVFEQLVNPRHTLSKKTIEITGIEPEMLIHQPGIEEVLKIFNDFCKDTVLVAHNASFDMRFLQMKELKTGIRFNNPLLDTLLLSAVVHPNQASHNLESIAERLGINIIGRHTALGDAIATGEVLLKLLTLLNGKGIYTYRDARRASQERYYARAKF